MPLSRYILLIYVSIPLYAAYQQPIAVMLSPIGDALVEGRKAPESAERAVTRTLVTQIRENLNKEIPQARVVVTHYSGESTGQIEKAQYANTTGTLLYVAIGCYTAPQPQITVIAYQQDCHQTGKLAAHALYPVSESWRLVDSRVYAQTFVNHLNNGVARKHMPPATLMFAPLKDLQALVVPAIFIDIGIPSNASIDFIAQVLAQALATMIMV